MDRLVCNISLRSPNLPPLCFWTLNEEITADMQQDLHVKAGHRVRVSGQTVARKGMKLPYGNYQVGIKMAVSWGRRHVILFPKRNRSFQNSSFDSVYHSMHTTISGYWEGPDMEDGWGYVEAVVHRGH